LITTFVILGVTIVLFVWGRWPPDLVALLSLLALSGVIGTSDALSGFGNPTVVMIAALFVVGEGLSLTGVTGWGGKWLLEAAQGSKIRLLVVVMIGTAILSAFISNTGTVATLLPVIVAAAWAVGSVPSKFLMPLAFAANTGGLLTLAGRPGYALSASSSML
jgi:di/tricarboxylate transporter